MKGCRVRTPDTSYLFAGASKKVSLQGRNLHCLTAWEFLTPQAAALQDEIQVLPESYCELRRGFCLLQYNPVHRENMLKIRSQLAQL